MLSSIPAANRPAARSQLIERGLPMVRRLAFRMARRLPPSVDARDLIGAGTEGLLKALSDYDPMRYPRFEPYAELRIRGAMLDELRALDPMTRYGRQRVRDIAKLVRRLESELGRPPSEEEVAGALGVSLDEYQRMSRELASGAALGRTGALDPDEVDAGFDDPASLLGAAELRHRVAQAISSLPDRMQIVLALYYQEECTQSEIGRIVGVTESRVCQILGEATARLRVALADA